MPETEYLKHHAMSNSMMHHLKRSPAHYKAALEHGQVDTPALLLGSAVHALVLEGEEAFLSRFHIASDDDPVMPRSDSIRAMIAAIQAGDFDSRYAVPEPPLNRRTKEGKAQYKAYLDEGFEVVSQADYFKAQNYADYLMLTGNKKPISQAVADQAFAMRDAVLSHPVARKLLASGEAEQSFFWTDPDTGVECKARLDFITSHGIVADLKTSSDASQDEFCKSISRYGYYRQDAFYNRAYRQAFGKSAKGFVFIVVEKEPPYAIAIYTLDAESRATGDGEIDSLLRLYKRCLESDSWPSYSEKIETISLPRWHK